MLSRYSSLKSEYTLLIGAKKLKYNADTCKLLEGITTIGSMRIYNRSSLGNIVMTLMMVGYKEINTYAFCILYLFDSRNSGINGNYKLSAVFL